MASRLFLLAIGVLCFLGTSYSQGPILQAPIIFSGSSSVTTLNLLDVTLLNFKKDSRFIFEASIKYDAACNGNYQAVAFFKIDPVIFTPAGKIEASELTVYDARWKYTVPAFQTALFQTGFLPQGCYEVCYKLLDMVEHTPTNACTSFKIESNFPFYLLTPFDQSEVVDLFPILSWTPYDGAPNANYRLALAEVYPGQSAVEAILNNVRKFGESNINNTFLQYPLDASALENCRHYAWQVNVLKDNKVVKSSEVWEFNTPCKVDLNPSVFNTTFNQLGEDTDHIPFVMAGDTLRFILMQPYDEIKQYRLTIESLNEFQKNRVKWKKVDHTGADLKSNDLQTGENFCMIDLKQSGYIPGNQYLLKAENQKSAFFLHFQYLKPE